MKAYKTIFCVNQKNDLEIIPIELNNGLVTFSKNCNRTLFLAFTKGTNYQKYETFLVSITLAINGI